MIFLNLLVVIAKVSFADDTWNFLSIEPLCPSVISSSHKSKNDCNEGF